MSQSAIANLDTIIDAIIAHCDGDIRLAAPLGLGKPVQLINAIYQRVEQDPSLKLTIITALSLIKPRASNDLQRRFLQPFIERVYQNYEELSYMQAVNTQTLPSNIEVIEFFFQPGSAVNNGYRQQHYISSNYTHAGRDILDRDVNVLVQQVCLHEQFPIVRQLSLSCNPEISLDMLTHIETVNRDQKTILCIAQANTELPYMGNSAAIDADKFDFIWQHESANKTLFSAPNMPIKLREHIIGSYASTLIKDGGTLQIGIGSLGDAVANALIWRDQDNKSYRSFTQGLKSQSKLTDKTGGFDTFNTGLYGCSEMLSYGLFRLFEENIIRRQVSNADGQAVSMHAGFFLGPQALYQGLIGQKNKRLDEIDMCQISFINHLYGDETLKRQQRTDARFVNTAFSATLLGAAISDQIENGQVLSGVGGQYNFVAQAHELEQARSIILLRASRDHGGETLSNIVWEYPHHTIPRHLRDIYITEYGIADCRGRTDSEVIAAMLNIADSRFQQDLLDQAKAAHKIATDYQIPTQHCNNFPEAIESHCQRFAHLHQLSEFPLGSDFEPLEQQLLKALGWLKQHLKPSALLQLAKQLPLSNHAETKYAAHLERMGLSHPNTMKEHIYHRLVLAALEKTQDAAC